MQTPIIQENTITALEISDRVIDVVESEPRRLLMDHFVTGFNHDYNIYFSRPGAGYLLPDCGTVCCVAGWFGAITREPADTRSTIHDSYRFSESWARFVLLGEDRQDEWSDRSSSLHGCFYHMPDLTFMPGTAEYVQEALVPFKAWVEENREFLANRVVDLKQLREVWNEDRKTS